MTKTAITVCWTDATKIRACQTTIRTTYLTLGWIKCDSSPKMFFCRKVVTARITRQQISHHWKHTQTVLTIREVRPPQSTARPFRRGPALTILSTICSLMGWCRSRCHLARLEMDFSLSGSKMKGLKVAFQARRRTWLPYHPQKSVTSLAARPDQLSLAGFLQWTR